MMVRRSKDLDAARAKHDRGLDAEKPTREGFSYVPSREEDNSWLGNANYQMRKWAIFWGPAVAIASALNFGVITPRRAVRELKEHNDSVAAFQQRQIDAVKVDQNTLRALLDSVNRGLTLVVRVACVRRELSADTKQLIGLYDASGECIR